MTIGQARAMTQTAAVQQWWAGLTTVERYAVLQLPPADGLPHGFALGLVEHGVAVQRAALGLGGRPASAAFPEPLLQHLARVRTAGRTA